MHWNNRLKRGGEPPMAKYSPKLYNTFYNSETSCVRRLQHFDRNFSVVRSAHAFANQDGVVN